MSVSLLLQPYVTFYLEMHENIHDLMILFSFSFSSFYPFVMKNDDLESETFLNTTYQFIESDLVAMGLTFDTILDSLAFIYNLDVPPCILTVSQLLLFFSSLIQIVISSKQT